MGNSRLLKNALRVLVCVVFGFSLISVSPVASAGSTFYVANDSPPGGDGSLENPFNTLVAAEAAAGIGDSIAVLLGDGTSMGQDEGIVLKDGQELSGLKLPVITNGDGDGVALASSTEVSGLLIEDVVGSGELEPGGGFGILGVGISGFDIRGNTITGSLTGPTVANGSGSGMIAFNTLLGNQIFGVGILKLDGGHQEASVLSNNIAGGGVGVSAGVQLDSNLTLHILENEIDGANEGIFLSAGTGSGDSSRLAATAAKNQITLAAEPDEDESDRIGIKISGNDQAEMSIDVLQNDLADSPGILIDPERPAWAMYFQSYLDANISTTITGNTIQGTDGLELSAQDNSYLEVTFNDNEVTDTRGRFNANFGDFSTGVVRIFGNTFHRSLAGGISIDAEFESRVEVTIAGNEIVDTGDPKSSIARRGIVFGQPSYSEALLRINSNIVTGSTGPGIEITRAGLSVLYADVSGNHLNGNTDAGLIVGGGGARVCLRLNDNTGQDPLILGPGKAFSLEPPRNNENPISISDDIVLVPRGTCFPGIFSDGFETGDTSAWTTTSL